MLRSILNIFNKSQHSDHEKAVLTEVSKEETSEVEAAKDHAAHMESPLREFAKNGMKLHTPKGAEETIVESALNNIGLQSAQNNNRDV